MGRTSPGSERERVPRVCTRYRVNLCISRDQRSCTTYNAICDSLALTGITSTTTRTRDESRSIGL